MSYSFAAALIFGHDNGLTRKEKNHLGVFELVRTRDRIAKLYLIG
jgi:hypothetical protein